jgi:cobalt-precorrin-5B (C1)-methyltransferase
VAAAEGQQTVVFTTGGRTEKCAMRSFPALPEVCFVQMGDFVKAAFDAALKHGIRNIVVGAMAGKLTKMAQGLPVTHAWRQAIDSELLGEVAARIGAPAVLCEEIRAAQTARFAVERLALQGLDKAFHMALAARARDALLRRYPRKCVLTILVCDFEGNPVGLLTPEDS